MLSLDSGLPLLKDGVHKMAGRPSVMSILAHVLVPPQLKVRRLLLLVQQPHLQRLLLLQTVAVHRAREVHPRLLLLPVPAVLLPAVLVLAHLPLIQVVQHLVPQLRLAARLQAHLALLVRHPGEWLFPAWTEICFAGEHPLNLRIELLTRMAGGRQTRQKANVMSIRVRVPVLLQL